MLIFLEAIASQISTGMKNGPTCIIIMSLAIDTRQIDALGLPVHTEVGAITATQDPILIFRAITRTTRSLFPINMSMLMIYGVKETQIQVLVARRIIWMTLQLVKVQIPNTIPMEAELGCTFTCRMATDFGRTLLIFPIDVIAVHNLIIPDHIPEIADIMGPVGRV
ncbi:hypothetical protein BCR34DRAFT_333453 [Clohesyomyces aquaticus]|uniref:Uncharacterized protein n=1 Tax=Clohesyomyces aquaticus TaxID=1231657 RepID=A0A1Y1ZLL7_9PLEO|nr:hypothetical protein BCR34DRAFT_333453 [Clohesyomyces aquaticus]